MTMNQALRAATRDLTAKVRLTLANGAVVQAGQAEVISFSVDEGADSPLLPGAVLSAKYTLVLANDEGQWRWGGSLRGERPLVGATAQLFVHAGEQDIPCGVFIVDSVSADEGSGVIRLSGSDSIAHELSAEFTDNLTYPATLGQLWACWLSQTPYAFDGSFPGGEMIIPAAPKWKKAALRRAAGWIVQAAGCFLRVNRTGALELVSCRGRDAVSLTPDDYMTLSDGFETFGPVHELTVVPADADDAPLTVSDGLGAAVSVSGNPLFTAGDHLAGMAEALLEVLSGLVLTKADFRWRGDPAVSVGDAVALTDTSGAVLRCTVTRQTLKFDRGFSASVSCAIPESRSGGVVRAVTPEGGLNAAALVGAVDGSLLRAQSVTAKAIAANVISAGHLSANAVTAEKIAAGSVSAEKLAAGAVTAEKLHADSVSGRTAQFVAAKIAAIEAKDIETNALYAAFAHLIELAAGSIAVGDVRTDRLAAQLAKVVSLQAAVGDFDFAAAQNLVAGALSLERGAAESVYIRNLAVTSANLLSATLGNLVIRGSDGRYYRVFVGSDGGIGTEEVTVTGGEISAGQTSTGNQILETNLNVANLNASNLQAGSAVINQILTTALTAGKITAAEAMIASATIPALYTTAVRAIGDGLDLSANRSIRAMVGGKAAVFRNEIPPADADSNDLWIQPSTGYTWQLARDGAGLPEFYLDEAGDLYCGGAYALRLDEAGNLCIDDGALMTIGIAEDGAPVFWQRVRDGEWVRAIDETTFDLERRISASHSHLEQRADGFEADIRTLTARGDELRTYMRYEGGTLELGRSDSRYTTQTSDRGFVVLQDGSPMASMEQNIISAPVINAQRMFTIGDHVIRMGASGHLIFN